MRSASLSSVFKRHLRPTVFAMSLAQLGLAAACGSDSPIAPVSVAEVAGVRPMKTANNVAVPTTFTDGSGKKLTIKTGSLTIEPNGHFSLHYVGNLGTLDFDLHETGIMTVNGSTLVFTPDDDDAPFTGSRSGNNIVAGFKIAGVKFDLGFQP